MAAVDDSVNNPVDVVPAVKNFVWHPVLMSLGMAYLFGCSAVLFRVVPSMKMNKDRAKILHSIILGAALVISLVGCAFAFQMFEGLGEDHYKSVHATLGLATMVLFAAQWIISIPVFLWPKAPVSVRVPGISVHIYVGVGVFVCAAICNVTGFNSRARKGNTEKSRTYYKIAGLLHVVFTLIILFMVSVRKYKKSRD